MRSIHRRSLLAAFAAAALPPGPAVARVRAGAEAHLLRGWLDLFSYGLDDLARKLAASGVAAEVHSYEAGLALGRRIVTRRRGGAPAGPLILIGHSLGANEALRLARWLGQAGVATDLLITIDPTAPEPVSSSVRQAVNYYASSAGWGRPVSGSRVVNADLAGSRRDLARGGAMHSTIDKNPAIHAEIVALAARTHGVGGRRAP